MENSKTGFFFTTIPSHDLQMDMYIVSSFYKLKLNNGLEGKKQPSFWQ